MSPPKKQAKKTRFGNREESSSDDDFLKQSPSRPNYFDMLSDSENEDPTVNESPNHSVIVQFLKEKLPKEGMYYFKYGEQRILVNTNILEKGRYSRIGNSCQFPLRIGLVF